MRLLPLTICFFLIVVTGCSTYVEDLASEDFLPVIPEEDSSLNMVDGAIYSQQTPGLFATEKKANNVGDIVTISLNESFNASKSQSAVSGKQDSVGLTMPTVLVPNFTPEGFTYGTTQNFNGTGSASQSNSLTGLVSASIVRRFANGNLEVLGQKKLTLNNGDEYIRVRGTVRPEDIGLGNIINSNRLANAEITYIGAGDIADTAKRGWLSKILTTISPI